MMPGNTMVVGSSSSFTVLFFALFSLSKSALQPFLTFVMPVSLAFSNLLIIMYYIFCIDCLTTVTLASLQLTANPSAVYASSSLVLDKRLLVSLEMLVLKQTIRVWTQFRHFTTVWPFHSSTSKYFFHFNSIPCVATVTSAFLTMIISKQPLFFLSLWFAATTFCIFLYPSLRSGFSHFNKFQLCIVSNSIDSSEFIL